MHRSRALLVGMIPLLLLVTCLPVMGAAGDFTYGADLRVRESIFSNVPLAVGGTLPDMNFIRVRPRVWGNYGISDNMSVYAMITNEFRYYIDPEGTKSWEFPDEYIVDNLYLDMTGLAGGDLDLRIGRQNLIYGTGKVILDGTPGDGSRTIYFDAIKATWKGFEDMTLDVLAIYDMAENPLAIASEERNLNNYSGRDGKNEANELGVGLYLKHKGLAENWPFEAYYLLKQEAEYALAGGGKSPSVTVNTIGVRVMPKLSDSLTGNLEIAYQMGSVSDVDVDMSGLMIDAKLTMVLAALEQYKAKASLGFYMLSGDDPTTADYEGWTPSFARWPQYSELYIYSFIGHRGWVADWTNIMMPYVEIAAVPHAKLNSTLLVGMMNAPEKNGPGGDADRGILFTWWNKFKLMDGILTDQDSLSGHLLLEAVAPGGYYADGADTATWLRWEFFYAFK